MQYPAQTEKPVGLTAAAGTCWTWERFRGRRICIRLASRASTCV